MDTDTEQPLCPDWVFLNNSNVQYVYQESPEALVTDNNEQCRQGPGLVQVLHALLLDSGHQPPGHQIIPQRPCARHRHRRDPDQAFAQLD